MNLLKISMLISFLGIYLLLLISGISQPKLIKIDKINLNQLNKKIKIQGKIVQHKNYNNFQILTIQDDTGKIEALLNVPAKLISPIKTKNKTLTITGRVSQYNLKLQIQVEKITS